MRNRLLDKLDRATTAAVSYATTHGLPINISANNAVVGKVCVSKNRGGFFDIVSVGGIVYKNIYTFEIAVIVAQRIGTAEYGIIQKVLSLEEKFAKHHTDMLHYLNCLKAAKKNRDIERMTILEDKFQSAEVLAKGIRANILLYKRDR